MLEIFVVTQCYIVTQSIMHQFVAMDTVSRCGCIGSQTVYKNPCHGLASSSQAEEGLENFDHMLDMVVCKTFSAEKGAFSLEELACR